MQDISWNRLWDGQLEADAEERVLQDAVTELNAILTRRAEASDGVERIIEASTSQPPSEGIYGHLQDGLKTYLDSDSANLFTWVGDSSERLNRVLRQDAERASTLLKKIKIVFGRRIWRLYQISLGLWEDWEYFQPTVAFDQQVEQYLLRFDITKVNGERVRIESRPDSFLDLTGWLLRILIDMNSRDSFGDETLKNFLSNMDELNELLRPAPQEAVRQPSED